VEKVIPNHVREAEGRSGEGSHARKEPILNLSLVVKTQKFGHNEEMTFRMC